MILFRKVAIVGTGLIGGSVALAIKKHGLAGEIIGISRRRKTLSKAKKMRSVDKASQSLEAIKDADLVILATPVSVIIEQAPKIAEIIKPGCIVTDVGSTKAEIVSKLSRRFKHFIGAHPLAGSEKRGVINAHADLFKKSLCILTPAKNTDRLAMRKVEKLWRSLGARVAYLAPQAHDRALAFVSHLPHAASFSLISSVPGEFLRFASSGLKDTTRIAGSDSQLWTDIFLSNRKNIASALGQLQQNISRIKSAIQRQDRKELSKILKQAQEKRKSLA